MPSHRRPPRRAPQRVLSRRFGSKTRASALAALALTVAACGAGDARPEDADATGASEVFSARASGAWDGALGATLPEPVSGVGFPGDLAAPESLAVTAERVLVLDRARARVVAFTKAGDASPLVVDARLAGAIDLAIDAAGDLWVEAGGCRCASRRAGATWHDVAIADELYARHLVPAADGALALADLGGAAVHPLVDASGVAQSPDAQRAAVSVGVAGGWSLALPADAATSVTLVDPGGASQTLELSGRPLAVELLAAAPAACGGDARVVVVKVLTPAGAAHDLALVRPGVAPRVVASAPAARSFKVPFRAFAAGPEGDVWQLRLEPDGWSLAAWEVPCD